MASGLNKKNRFSSLTKAQYCEEITEKDNSVFSQITSCRLTPQHIDRIVNPDQIYPHQREVLAVHWHPEFIPVDIIIKRIQTMFPNRERELIIPTQHNTILSHQGLSGVEVDCYSRGFNQKIQLLLHFQDKNLEKAHVLKSMIEHTRGYRVSQLFDYIKTITHPVQERLDQAARETGADEELISFVQVYVRKVQTLLDENLDKIAVEMIKNKLLSDFFEGLRADFGHRLIDRVQNFLKAVKEIVKLEFPLHHFYRTSEIIEEARYHSGGIVVPHPEQFWPVLLMDYDVDGYEVWNPQSQRYTDFLISVVNSKNNALSAYNRRILIFMGDDTHMSEKLKDNSISNKFKSNREIGLQPAWEDISIRKKLFLANADRRKTIDEYRQRLLG